MPINEETDRQTECYEEANIHFWKQESMCTKFVYDRLWAMLPVDCDVCTGAVGDNSKNWTEGSVWADRQYGGLEEEINNLTLPGIETRLLCYQQKVQIFTDWAIKTFALPTGERPDTQWSSVSVWKGKCRLRQDSIPGPLSTQPAVIPSDLSCPSRNNKPH